MGARRLLLGTPRFLVVWLIGGLTGIVRWLQLLVLGLYTFQMTDSPLLVSAVPMLWMLPLALCGPLIGVVADRVNRKLLLVGSLAMALAVSIAMVFASRVGAFGFSYVAAALGARRDLLGDGHAGAPAPARRSRRR